MGALVNAVAWRGGWPLGPSLVVRYDQSVALCHSLAHLVLLNGLGLLISLLIMAYRGYRSPSPLVRQQARIIFYGSVLAFTPLVLFFIPASQMVDVAWLPSAFYLPPLVIYPLAIAYTIIRYRLLDFDLVLRRSISYAAMTGFLLLAFFLVTVGLTNTFGAATENPVLLSMLVVVMVLLYNPLRTRLQGAIDQLFLPSLWR